MMDRADFIRAVGGNDWYTGFLVRAIKPGFPTIDLMLTNESLQLTECWNLNIQGYNIYYGVALRGHEKQPTKVRTCWLDIDFKHFDDGIMNIESKMLLNLLSSGFNPNFIVKSGHGLHAYWTLDKYSTSFDRIETINRKLALKFHGDRVHNIDRLMRLPGFFNMKHPDNPIMVEITHMCNTYGKKIEELEEYLQDIEIPVLRPQTKALIAGKHADKFSSRSERDFAAVIGMVETGYIFDEIRDVFETEPIGDKYKEKGQYAQTYLEKTFNAACLAANVDTEI